MSIILPPELKKKRKIKISKELLKFLLIAIIGLSLIITAYTIDVFVPGLTKMYLPLSTKILLNSACS